MKKILFNQCLIPSVMDRTKTKTRRLIKPQPDGPLLGKCQTSSIQEMIGAYTWLAPGDNFYVPKPRYQVGEVVYVGEAWMRVPGEVARELLREEVVSDRFIVSHQFKEPWFLTGHYGLKWKSPMFMPQEAARTFLKITDVRAERICDISEEDCIAEGVEKIESMVSAWTIPVKLFSSNEFYSSAQEAFFALLRYVNKGKAVDLNDWVWVYTFERTEKPHN